MDAILKAADFAAQRNDRYLFVALLLLCVVGIAIIAKWLAGQYNRILREWREDMGAIQRERREDMRLFSDEVMKLHKERVEAADTYAGHILAIHKTHTEESRSLFRDYANTLSENSKAMTAVARSLTDLQHACSTRAQLTQHIPIAPRGDGQQPHLLDR